MQTMGEPSPEWVVVILVVILLSCPGYIVVDFVKKKIREFISHPGQSLKDETRAPEKQRYFSPLRLAKTSKLDDIERRTFSRHAGTQTAFTCMRTVIEPDERTARRRNRRKPEEEFTFVNLDPEQCTRCSNVGYNKCKLCLTPYCSAKCKTKDHPRHRKECPEMRNEEKQREAKEQEYESCIKSLREDNDRLKEQSLCKVCLEEDAGVVFDPCGHLCCCHDCSTQLRVCPMCRKDVKKPIKVFI